MIDGLGPYAWYANPSIQGLKATPVHWTVARLKTVFREVDERSGTGTQPLLSLRMQQGLVDHLEAGGKPIPATSLTHYKVTRPGDLVMNRMRAASGLFGVTPKLGLVSPDYAILRPRRAVNLHYFAHLFRTPAMMSIFRLESRGLGTGESGFLRLYTDRFGMIAAPVPPIEEQSAIVKFLDHADRLIYRYVRAKRRLIKLLEAQKQTIIYQAVTCGLDPDVPVKDSGVPWIPALPAHWKIERFKTCVLFKEGPGIMAADFRDSGVPLLRIAGLRGDTASLEGCNFLDPSMVEKRWSHFRVRSGDYLLSSSASTGKVVSATDVVTGAIPYTGIIRLRPISLQVHMPFVCLYLGSRPFQDQIDAAKSGVGIEHFGPTHLKRMVIAMPPLAEQQEIAEYARYVTKSLDPAADSARREIDLLRELRTRLISDVVTGQLDVREAAADLPDVLPDTDEPLNEPDSEDDEDPEVVPDEPED